MKATELANYPWVFWVNISYRKWFSGWWHTRGANFIEFQLWRFRISIGMPWLQCVIDAYQRDCGSTKYVHKTNQDNLSYKFSFLMKSPVKNRVNARLEQNDKK